MKRPLNFSKENAPKKYVVSKHITNVYFLGAGVLTACLMFFCYMLRYATPDALTGMYFLVASCAVSILLSLKVILFDTPSYRFSISKSGVTMYIRRREYFIRWDEVIDWDIIMTPISYQDTSRIHWLYFSKRHLTKKEIQKFNTTVLKSHGEFACLQCGAKTYSEIRQYMPPKMRDELDASFGILDGMMTKKERRLNK